MQPRQLRVGDLVDDYCPRERRLSNHAIVALVGEDVRQVRCTTCDAEHEYRGGKVPASRKKKAVVGPPALAPAREVAAAPAAVDEPLVAEEPPFVEEAAPGAAAAAPADAAERDESPAETPEDSQPPSPHAEISLHRRLIRATLPRVESDTPTRPIPEFTMHRAAAAHGHRHGKPFRHGQGGQPRHGKGGFGQGRHGQGEPNGNTLGPPRGGQGQRSGHGGRGGPRGSQVGHGGHGNPQGQRHSRHGFGRGPKKH